MKHSLGIEATKRKKYGSLLNKIGPTKMHELFNFMKIQKVALSNNIVVLIISDQQWNV
jgi:hypothetical protein